MAKQIAMTSDKKILVLNDSIEGVDTITVDSELSNASTNPVQNKVVKAAIEGRQDKISANGLLKGDGTTISAAVPGTDYAAASHNHDSSYLKLSGGTLTGNLTGKYITGTWLQTTAATALGSAAKKICVLDNNGWVYYRTPEQILSDIGAPAADTKQEKITASGILKGDGTTISQAVAGTDYAAADHTHSDVTTEASGLMSAADKTKLDGIVNGANKTTVDSYLSSSSTNPVQNKVINTALNKKAPAYTYSMTDLTPGTSTLETGKLYIVYK